MKISLREWSVFAIVAVLCLGIWCVLEYPRYSFVDISVDKKTALSKAESYLASLGVNPKEYLSVIVFRSDDWADRYLQKTLGAQAEEAFLKKHRLELFSWRVRFFKELQKEEYLIKVSPTSGQVVRAVHYIEDIAPREAIDKDTARQKAQEYLKGHFGIDFNEYEVHEEQERRFDKRVDYSFSWKKKGVYIPWKKDEGGAKLLTGATVSGNEIRDFYRNLLDIPERFERYIDNQLSFGAYLYNIYFVLLIILISWSIAIVVKRKQAVVVRICKKWYIKLAIFFFIISVIDVFNNMQGIIIDYPTSISLVSYAGNCTIWLLLNILFYSAVFLMPGLAGESLSSENSRSNKYGSFAYYLKTNFYSRGVANSIFMGYLLFFIMLGLQAAIFFFGQKYCGVWKEWNRLVQFSSAYLPFVSAFIIGVTVSLNEEIVFRLFGINLGKRYLKSTILAVVLSAFIWGFGHSAYAIFPFWFRGVEVTLIGILLGIMFIRYGLIVVLVAHYLFDVFMGLAAYMLGHSSVYMFSSSIFVLAIPFIFALAAYFINNQAKEREIKAFLSSVDAYNLNILLVFISAQRSQGLSAQAIKEELLRNNWDPALVELALNTVFKS